MSPQRPRDPFRSDRLFYRAVRVPEDDTLFQAINDDHIGYVNSNASNITLPSQEGAQRFRKSVAQEALMGAVICLPASANTNTERDGKEEIEQSEDDDKPGTPIGQIHLTGVPRWLQHHRNTEIGVDILPQYQGKGYGGEAINWALNYAFRKAGMHKVRIRAFEWNPRAIRLYERLGFKHEGRERESLWHEGRFWDGLELGMIDREWWEMQRKSES